MVSRLDHPIQGVSLVVGITPQRIHQVGNEISAALELHIYSGPAFFGKLPRAHKFVVEVNEVANCEEQNGEDDKKYFHEMYSFALQGAVNGSSRIAFSWKDSFQLPVGRLHCSTLDIKRLERNIILCRRRNQPQIKASGELLATPVFTRDINRHRDAVAISADGSIRRHRPRQHRDVIAAMPETVAEFLIGAVLRVPVRLRSRTQTVRP